MMDQRQQQVIDYVLNLLPDDAQQQIESEARHDATLRQAIQHERQIVHAVRGTLGKATAPNPLQLKKLMPAIPRQPAGFGWQRPMTWAGALFLMILVAFGWRSANSIGAAGTSVPGVAITVTQTEAPTMTMTQTVEADNSFYSGGISLVSTRAAPEPIEAQAPVAFPAAAPIAAFSFTTP